MDVPQNPGAQIHGGWGDTSPPLFWIENFVNVHLPTFKKMGDASPQLPSVSCVVPIQFKTKMQWWLRGESNNQMFDILRDSRTSLAHLPLSYRCIDVEYNVLLITPRRPAWRNCSVCYIATQKSNQYTCLVL